MTLKANRRRRILFFSEAVTLAHVVRPVTLADSLDPSLYEVHFASAYRQESLFKEKSFTYWPIESVSYEAFLNSVGGGTSAYDDEQLETYLMEEEAMIREIEPDLIVSDTRLTLGVSAPACGVPLVNINNAYWSPFRKDKQSPVPAYQRSALYNLFPRSIADRIFPYGLVKRIFPFMKPLIQRQFLAPFNRARKRRGLKAFKDFETFYTWGDWTLYCDTPELVPLEGAPNTHRYLGPILWSPPDSEVLPKMEGSRPTVYVSFGSSNDVPRCREIIDELARLDVELLVATAGRFEISASERVQVAEYLPGLEACRRAAVVVSSGGSTAAYQALSAGTPVLGIPSNMDQYLSMGNIERREAGLSIRSDHVTPRAVREAVAHILADGKFKRQAEAMSKSFQSYDAIRRFREFVEEVLPQEPLPPRGGKVGMGVSAVELNPPPLPSPTRGEGISGMGSMSAMNLQTVPERLRRRALASPDQPAFWGLAARARGEAPLRYGELWAQVQSLALGLRELGLERGERVGFLAAVEPGWELMQEAVLLAGGVVVGLDVHDLPDRVMNAAQQSEIRCWVVQNVKVLSEWTALFAKDLRFIVLLSDSAPAERAQVMTLAQLLNRHQGKSWTAAFPESKDLATIIFTSGTTAEPKGVAYTHAQLVHAVRAIVRAYRSIPEGFQSACWLPLSNLFQRIVNLCAIERGAVITFIPHPNQLVDSLPLIGPDVLIGVPRFYEKLEAGIRKAVTGRPWPIPPLFRFSVGMGGFYRGLRQKKNIARVFFWPIYRILDGVFLWPVRKTMGGRIKFLVSGSAPIGRKTLEFFWGIGLLILEVYGTSENSVPLSLNRPQRFSFETTGRPLAPNEVEITPDREVIVKGPGVFGGYWKKAGVSSQFRGAYYRTGDEGQWENGFLKLLGRRSEFIKTSTGRRVAPAPIEQAFKEVPFVDQAVLLGNGRKSPVLLVTVNVNALSAPAGVLRGMESEGFPAEMQDQVRKIFRDKARGLPLLLQPLGIIVLNRAFSVLRGEMTANLKLRRQAIETKYLQVLDQLYETKRLEEGPMVWFLGGAEVRMQEFQILPSLSRIKSHLFPRWLSLGRLLLQGLRWYGKYAYALLQKPWDYRNLQTLLFERLVCDYRDIVGPLKGPLVKIGQTLSYVELGLAPHFQKFLEELQEKSPPLASKEIRRVIRESLGRTPEELFAEWHDAPVAAASISQIHLARLKNGRRVAVKVRYPGVERLIKSDLLAVRMFLPLISQMTGIENVQENYQEARRLFLGECDFRRELKFMQRFQEIFAGHPRIAIPEVFPDYCSESVLTMEYVEGQNYQEFKATASQESIDQAGKAINEFFAVAALRHCLFNADPHPGNYLFANGRVYFLDFGFCKEWPQSFMTQWKRQTRAVIANDLPAFADATEKMGVKMKDARFDYAALLQSYRSTVSLFLVEDRTYRFTRDYIRKATLALLQNQVALNKVYSPPEVLAFSRLFWGQHSILADLGSNVNLYRIVRPCLDGDSKDAKELE